MSGYWAERQRNTNRLVRLMAGHVLAKRYPTPEQLYGLCKLTWITNSDPGPAAAYVRSTKIPAVGHILSRQYLGRESVEDVAAELSVVVGPQASQLFLQDSGFTNFYKAYRNTALTWIRKNFESVLPLFKSAYRMGSDADGLWLIEQIEGLRRIPKANDPDSPMNPAYLLTPVFFALDPRVRFPVINGNERVVSLLTRLGMRNASLAEKYSALISLYGEHGIEDAADLDSNSDELVAKLGRIDLAQGKTLLKSKAVSGRKLPAKDEQDIDALRKSLSGKMRQEHNKLTNQLKKIVEGRLGLLLTEGDINELRYDAMIENYDGKGNGLLIEVKSSIELPHIRMAVGQVLDYWYALYPSKRPHVAVLLPEEPSQRAKALLNKLKIGLLWFNSNGLQTATSPLRELCRRTR